MMVEISHLFIVINSSLNFPIYCVASGSTLNDIFSSFRLKNTQSSPNRWRPSVSSATSASKKTIMIPLDLATMTSTSLPQTPTSATTETTLQFEQIILNQELLEDRT